MRANFPPLTPFAMNAIDPSSQSLASASLQSMLDSETARISTSQDESDANSPPAADQPVTEEVKVEYVRREIPGITKVVRFDALARCGDEVWIENDGQMYRLRRTRQGKLILTK